MDIIYTVSEFNKMVKEILDREVKMHDFFLEGELSGVTYYKSGHLYFTLKDKNSQVKCVAFNYRLKKIVEDLKEGENVKIFGDVGFYEIRGDFQILVRYIERQDKKGELFKKLEKVKKKLEEEGFFLRKRELPECPTAIGVVTAYTGAAFYDIINTTKKRFENIDIYIYSAKVQGEGAKEEIIKGIEVLNKIPEIDLIIAGRGGGSIEDLWAFNEEEVARAFYSSKKPIISAVGHEIDYLLTDFVADVRASTPTQAVEISIPVKKELENKIDMRKEFIFKFIRKEFEKRKEKVRLVKESYILKNFRKNIEEKNIYLIEKEEKVKKLIKNIIFLKENELDRKIEKIEILNPIKVLKRGYTITRKSGKIVKSVEDIEIKDLVEIVFKNGKVKSEVKEIIR